MKSVKPGRGPSGMSFMGSLVAILFGVFWTAMAFGMTRGAGVIGMFFPLFGVLFVVMGIVQAAYHYKNATGKDRFSEYDVTGPEEEEDPAARWVKPEEPEMESKNESGYAYCPYCGERLSEDFSFCPKCGRKLPPKE